MNTIITQPTAREAASVAGPHCPVLLNISQLYGCKLEATDGQIGHVRDFLFSDRDWTVRYVVADTGKWLSERLVLLAPRAFTNFAEEKHELHVDLTRDQIEKSPAIDAHQPVSRQHEEEYSQYYGWPDYWNAGGVWGMDVYPVTPVMPLPAAPFDLPPVHSENNDPHLRSTKALHRYLIKTGNETVGHVTDFLMDEESWSLRYLIGESGIWFGGKQIVIATRDAEKISYEASEVTVNITKEAIQRSPEYHYVKGISPIVTDASADESGHSLFSDR